VVSQPESTDLAAAIAAAPDGGVVLVRGTVKSAPVRVAGKALTLRGVAGSRPVIERQAGTEERWDALLSSDRALTIEGLELRGTPSDLAPLVCVEGASLCLRDCKVHMPAGGPATALRGGTQLRLLGCELNAGRQAVAVEVMERPCSILARDCRVRVSDAAGVVMLAWSERERTSASVACDLRNCDVEAGRLLACRSVAGPVRVEAIGSRLDLRQQRVSYAGYRDRDSRPTVPWRETDAKESHTD
jgi:hypothetical protein